MPIYEYYCPECNKRFEELVMDREKMVNCPVCGRDASANRCMSVSSVGRSREKSEGPSAPLCGPT